MQGEPAPGIPPPVATTDQEADAGAHLDLSAVDGTDPPIESAAQLEGTIIPDFFYILYCSRRFYFKFKIRLVPDSVLQALAS